MKDLLVPARTIRTDTSEKRREVLAERDVLVTFLTHPGTDATNWRAEQAVRPAVVNRKVWGGNRTWRGATNRSSRSAPITFRGPPSLADSG
jgi:hypothetical protein